MVYRLKSKNKFFIAIEAGDREGEFIMRATGGAKFVFHHSVNITIMDGSLDSDESSSNAEPQAQSKQISQDQEPSIPISKPKSLRMVSQKIPQKPQEGHDKKNGSSQIQTTSSSASKDDTSQ